MSAEHDRSSPLSITEIRITLRDDEKLKAFVTITLDNCFVVRGMKIIKGAKGLFVAMPNRRKPDGTYQDLVHPINRETRNLMETLILEEYHRFRNKTGTDDLERNGVRSPLPSPPTPHEGEKARDLPTDDNVEWDGPPYANP